MASAVRRCDGVVDILSDLNDAIIHAASTSLILLVSLGKHLATHIAEHFIEYLTFLISIALLLSAFLSLLPKSNMSAKTKAKDVDVLNHLKDGKRVKRAHQINASRAHDDKPWQGIDSEGSKMVDRIAKPYEDAFLFGKFFHEFALHSSNDKVDNIQLKDVADEDIRNVSRMITEVLDYYQRQIPQLLENRAKKDVVYGQKLADIEEIGAVVATLALRVATTNEHFRDRQATEDEQTTHNGLLTEFFVMRHKRDAKIKNARRYLQKCLQPAKINLIQALLQIEPCLAAVNGVRSVLVTPKRISMAALDVEKLRLTKELEKLRTIKGYKYDPDAAFKDTYKDGGKSLTTWLLSPLIAQKPVGTAPVKS